MTGGIDGVRLMLDTHLVDDAREWACGIIRLEND